MSASDGPTSSSNPASSTFPTRESPAKRSKTLTPSGPEPDSSTVALEEEEEGEGFAEELEVEGRAFFGSSVWLDTGSSQWYWREIRTKYLMNRSNQYKGER